MKYHVSNNIDNGVIVNGINLLKWRNVKMKMKSKP